MKITIITVGKIKEKALVELIDEYKKRLSKYTQLEFIELQDEPIKENSKENDELIVKIKEGNKILSHIPSNSYKIVLDLKGKMLDSVEFSKKIDEVFTYESSHIVFIIGGSLGLSEDVVKAANYNLKLSNMTFTHNFAKLILLEQIYRAFKIINNETYHK